MRHALPIAAVAALFAAVTVTPADAKCTRLAFSVNDYGKDGPIKDAKAMLDTYIAKWTAERGIKSYRTGKKDVKCELFLDVIVFDEHTCRAEASVCWDEKNVGPVPKAAAADGATPAPAATKPKPAAKAAAPAANPVTTGTLPATVTATPPAAAAPAATPIAPVAPPAATPPAQKAAAPAATPVTTGIPATVKADPPPAVAPAPIAPVAPPAAAPPAAPAAGGAG